MCKIIALNRTHTTCLPCIIQIINIVVSTHGLSRTVGRAICCVAVPSTDQRCLHVSIMPMQKAKAAKAVAKAPAAPPVVTLAVAPKSLASDA